MKPMRVLHLLASNKFSGAENVACQIIKLFDGEVEMAYSSPNGPIMDKLSKEGIKFYPLQKLSIKEVKKVLHKFNPDIIHAHDVKATIMACLVAGKTPIVSHIHCNHKDFCRFSFRSLIFNHFVKNGKIKHTLFVSQSSSDDYYFNKNLGENSSILYNIIDVKNFYHKESQSTYQDKSDIIYFGRLCDIKDPERVINITNILRKSLPNIRVAVVGDGELKEKCLALTQDLGLEKNITFYGFLENGYGLMKNSKIMIMTSKSEGTPMSALEAQAFGLPIVSTKTSGAKELLIEGETGFLFESDMEGAERILSLLCDEQLYKKFQDNITQFSIQYNNIKSYKDVILRVYAKIM